MATFDDSPPDAGYSVADAVAALLRRVRALHRRLTAAALGDQDRPSVDAAVVRLANSVIRPLAEAVKALSSAEIS